MDEAQTNDNNDNSGEYDDSDVTEPVAIVRLLI